MTESTAGADRPMSDAELMTCVRQFRDRILNGRQSHRMCAMVCYPLQGFLLVCGIETKVITIDLNTTDHVYLKLPDGRVLDPTADQFKGFPPVYLGRSHVTKLRKADR